MLSMQRGVVSRIVTFLTVLSGGGGGGMTKKRRKALFAAQVHTHNGSRISEAQRWMEIISLEPPLLLHLHEKSTKIGTAHKSAVLLMRCILSQHAVRAARGMDIYTFVARLQSATHVSQKMRSVLFRSW
jgi:hypothetical protein